MANVLIIEDNKVTAEQIARCLQDAGHTTTIERSGSQVLDTVREKSPDLAILDIMLPGVSGFEVCRQLRSDPALYTLPVLMLSAMNDDQEVQHGLAQGADDYVVKPFDLKNLLQRVEALLRASSSQGGEDELTHMPGLDSTRREIQRRATMRKTFAVCHCELTDLREQVRLYGSDIRNRAIKAVGKVLAKCAESYEEADVFVGHLGGGHFIVLLPVKKTKTFCDNVLEVWKKTETQVLTVKDQGTQNTQGGGALDLLLCATIREADETTTPQQIFEVLSQIRHKALENQRSGIYLDRRGSRPPKNMRSLKRR